MVAASWARSLKLHGLAPDGRNELLRPDASSLALRREQMSRILHVSSPTMDRIFAALGLAGCSVVLCDADGLILDQRRRSAEDADFDQAGLTVGVDWSEGRQGTNGIGTCIVEARPVTIYRDQHFSTRNTAMSCMGAPVFDAEGALAGVLDVSTCRQDVDDAFAQLIAQTVRGAASQIEADHFSDVYADARIVRGPGDGQSGAVLLAVDSDDLVVGATRGARKAYGLPLADAFDPRPAADILGDAAARGVGLESAERRELRRALARAKGNMSAAARDLGLSRATLYRRAAKLGLTEVGDTSSR